MEDEKDNTAPEDSKSKGNLLSKRIDLSSDNKIPNYHNDEEGRSDKADDPNLPNINRELSDFSGNKFDRTETNVKKQKQKTKGVLDGEEKPKIQLLDLSGMLLKSVYNNDRVTLERELGHITNPKLFKYEVTMAFVLAVHLERSVAKFIYEYDEWIRSMVDKIIKTYQSQGNDRSLQDLSEINDSPRKSGKKNKKSIESSHTVKRENLDIDFLFKFKKFSIKSILKSDAAANFCTNALRICLF